MEIIRISKVRDFLNLRDQWNSLLSESGSDNIFLTWEWLYHWWLIFKKKNDELFILIALDNSKVTGIAPFFKSNGFYKKVIFLGSGIACSDYLSIIAERKNKAKFLKSVCEYLNANKDLYDAIYLESLVSDKETIFLFKNFIDQKSWKWIKLKEYVCYYLPLQSSQDIMKRLMDKGRIKRLTRKRANLSKIGQLEWKELEPSSSEDLFSGFDMAVCLHQKRWKDLETEISGLFSNKLFLRFLKIITEEFYKKSWLSLNFLTLNGKAIATEYNFKFNNKIANYTSGFDPEYMKDSPGAICLSENIKFYLKQGFQEFDFLRGEEAYKNYWTDDFRKTQNILIIKKGIKGNLLLFSKVFTKYIKKIIKLVFPDKIVVMLRSLKFNKSR